MVLVRLETQPETFTQMKKPSVKAELFTFSQFLALNIVTPAMDQG